MQDLRLTLHTFDRFGYYKKARGEGYRRFAGAVRPVLESLVEWLGEPQRTLRETKTFDAAENDDVLGVYCVYCRRLPNNAYIMCLWNATHEEDESVGCIQGNVPAANARVMEIDPPDGTFPGFPTYFYILPEEEKYLTVVPVGRLNGNRSFQRYMRGFLEQCPRYTVYEELEGGERIRLGYGHDNTQEVRNLKPVIKVSPVRSRGDLAWMREHLGDLKKIHRKKKLRHSTRDERTVIGRLAVKMGLAEPDVRYQDLKLEYSFECALTQDRFDVLVENEDLSRDDYNDIGFSFSGDDEPIRWVGSTLIKEMVTVEVNVGERGLFEPEVLSREVNRMAPLLIRRVQ